MALIIGMQVIRGDLPVGNPARCHLGIDGGLHADAGQIIVPSHLQVDVLRAGHGIVHHIVDQNHRRSAAKDPANQSFVGLPEMGIIIIVDAELHKNHVGMETEQVILHPCRTELGGGSADARIDILRLGIMPAPPAENPPGIAGFRG